MENGNKYYYDRDKVSMECSIQLRNGTVLVGEAYIKGRYLVFFPEGEAKRMIIPIGVIQYGEPAPTYRKRVPESTNGFVNPDHTYGYY